MNTTINTGGPAFPTTTKLNYEPATGAQWSEHIDPGMTLRDYFAAHAPEPPASWHGGAKGLSDVIEWRWWYADAMLKAR